MGEPQRVGDLEIQQDLAFQERMWQVQRVGWVIMALLLLAAALGLLGRGWLSRTTLGEAGDLMWIEYDRFAHLKADMTLDVHLNGSAGAGNEARLWLDRSYLERVQIERITPQPDSVEVTGERLTYVFKVSEAGEPVDVTFSLQPTDFGWLEGQVGLPDGPTLDFGQFVYP